MNLTPNVKKLVILTVSRAAIPLGGDIKDGIRFLSNKAKIIRTFKQAIVWNRDSIEVIRTVKDPNPFKNCTDEEIATEFLKRINDRNNKEVILPYPGPIGQLHS